MPRVLSLLVLAGLLLTGTRLPAAERIPAVPPRYFNDYAGVVAPATANQLNAQLEQFERDSSNQILVVLYPKMESDSSVEDYTVRVAQAWRVGQQKLNNGAVLFAFMQEHQLYIQVGYGLEPKLTDATARRIIEGEIVPRFHAGDVDGGMTAAVAAMIAATKGEYKGTGRTVADNRRRSSDGGSWGWVVVVFIFIVLQLFRRRQPAMFGGTRGGRFLGSPTIWTGGGSGWGNSGGSGGGGGGFSSGGGSFGGGGAGGSW